MYIVLAKHHTGMPLAQKVTIVMITGSPQAAMDAVNRASSGTLKFEFVSGDTIEVWNNCKEAIYTATDELGASRHRDEGQLFVRTRTAEKKVLGWTDQWLLDDENKARLFGIVWR